MLPFTTNKIIFQIKSVSLLALFFFLSFAFIPLETVYSAVTQEVTVSWDYTSPPPEEVAGFRLYQNGDMIYQINDPFASQVSIVILFDNAPSVFTITAFDVNDKESLHSTAFTYNPPLPSVDSDGDGLSDDVDPCPNDAANDVDGDGVCIEEGDCDDSDPSVYPGTTEVCDDGIDNNCDGNVDEGCYVCTDLDGDNYCAEVDDCDDSDYSVNPGAMEVCGNGIDDDCDTYFDCDDSDCIDDPICPSAVCSDHPNRRTCKADSGCTWNNTAKVCEDAGGTDSICSDYTDGASCVDNGCRWNKKKGTCR